MMYQVLSLVVGVVDSKQEVLG